MKLYARDIMRRNYDTINVNASVDKAIDLILMARVRPTGHKTVSLMVVDETERLVGTISMYYILYHLRPSYLNYGMGSDNLEWLGEIDQFVKAVREKTVGQIMNHNIHSATPDESLMTVLDRMIKDRIRRMPVVQNGKLVGVVYFSDIFYRLFQERS